MAVINIYSIQSRLSQGPASFMTFEFSYVCSVLKIIQTMARLKIRWERSHLFVDQFTFYRLTFEIYTFQQSRLSFCTINFSSVIRRKFMWPLMFSFYRIEIEMTNDLPYNPFNQHDCSYNVSLSLFFYNFHKKRKCIKRLMLFIHSNVYKK